MSLILIALLDVDYLSTLHLSSDTGQGGERLNTGNTICLVPTDRNSDSHKVQAYRQITLYRNGAPFILRLQILRWHSSMKNDTGDWHMVANIYPDTHPCNLQEAIPTPQCSTTSEDTWLINGLYGCSRAEFVKSSKAWFIIRPNFFIISQYGST